jgi:hypothetical protein
MSKYLKVQCQYNSREHLRAALKAAGIEFEETRIGQPESHLVGYHGDEREETATFIVRRAHIGSSSNDLGWHWNGKAFEEIVSQFDSGRPETTKIRDSIRKEYAVSFATAQARIKGWNVARINAPDGTVQLKVTGRI